MRTGNKVFLIAGFRDAEYAFTQNALWSCEGIHIGILKPCNERPLWKAIRQDGEYQLLYGWGLAERLTFRSCICR